MKHNERKVKTIIEKKLSLIRRSWQKSDGSRRFAYRARIWQSQLKRYAHFTLEAENERTAIEEAIKKWGELSNDIQSNRDLSSRKRNFAFFKAGFLQVQEQRAFDAEITAKRVTILRHHLASLERFWTENEKPTMDALASLYSKTWHAWRSEQTRSIAGRDSGRKLTPRYRNHETASHKMFFNWCRDAGHSTIIPQIPVLKTTRSNLPFPKDAYRRLLKISREEIQNIDTRLEDKRPRNVRFQWELMNLRTAILLMSGVGCRVLETRNLRWQDIQERKNGIFCYFYGKDKERTILLPGRVWGHLKDLRKFKESHQENYNATDFPFVFNGWKSAKPNGRYSDVVKKRWFEKAGLENPADWDLVCFRHKFITEALNNGAHSLTVAKYTGTSQFMIEKTYEGLVAGEVYDLVFKNVPSDALDGKNSPKWLEDLTAPRS